MDDPSRWAFDLDAYLLLGPDSLNEERANPDLFHAAYSHEHSHWVRHQASTIGLLLALIRRARTITAQHALAELDESGWQRVTERHAKGRPLWSFADGYDESFINKDFALMGQFVLDLEYSFHLLLDSTMLPAAPWSAVDAMSSCFTDAWRAAASFDGFREHPGNAAAERVVHGRVAPCVHGRDVLTTRGIWECASTLDEWRTPLGVHTPELREEVLRMSTAKIEHTPYGTPWRVANRLCPHGTTRAMFQLVTFIAMNPPLPFTSGEINAIEWSDLYPPERFCLAYSFVGQSDDLHQRLNDKYDDPTGIVQSILTATELPMASWLHSGEVVQGVQLRGKDPMGNPAVDFVSHPSVTQPLVGDLNAVINAGRAFRTAWAHSPTSCIWPSAATVLTAPDDQFDLAFRADKLSRPFLLRFADGLFDNGLLDSEQLFYFGRSHAQRLALESLLSGSPNVPTASVIDEVEDWASISSLVSRCLRSGLLIPW